MFTVHAPSPHYISMTSTTPTTEKGWERFLTVKNNFVILFECKYGMDGGGGDGGEDIITYCMLKVQTKLN